MNIQKLATNNTKNTLVLMQSKQLFKSNKNVSGLLENQMRRFSLNQQRPNQLFEEEKLKEQVTLNQLEKRAKYDRIYQRFFDDNSMFSKFMGPRSDSNDDTAGRSPMSTYNLSNQISNNKFKMQQASRDLQKYIDQQHILNKGKLIIPLALGELYKDQLIGKWLGGKKQISMYFQYKFRETKSEDEVEPKKKEEGGLETKDKKTEEELQEEDDDKHFDDWQGVQRQGQKSGSDSENDEDEEDDENNDDDMDGGVMMPIPV
ncbi:UNKNOWN [Stylonychia lemnae]|uniref:Uncharacterized protein n=1 Tax=Stylonychia lemnae TaxID=5949 RepID=A0A078BAE2_STYLE|nr:UNKNOWN [Stylonychia lemnae]|eukprot:CDW91525.1 UNKNOWN [Stylonychia lemnae]